ncbi:MAG: hypothetical protein WD070_05325 [Pirellulaceae bacterium]
MSTAVTLLAGAAFAVASTLLVSATAILLVSTAATLLVSATVTFLAGTALAAARIAREQRAAMMSTLLASITLTAAVTLLVSTAAVFLMRSVATLLVSAAVEQAVTTFLVGTALAIAATLLVGSAATLLVSSAAIFLMRSVAALLAGTIFLCDTIVATEIRHDAIEKLEGVCVGASQTEQASREQRGNNCTTSHGEGS